MVCIYCASPTRVINSRVQKKTVGVWRRRICLNCKAVFSTTEQADLSSSVMVLSKKGVLMPFYREKLLSSLLNALAGNERQFEYAAQLCTTIVGKLLRKNTAQLGTDEIISCASTTLKNFNHQAYARYVAEYASDSASIKLRPSSG